MIFRLSVLFLLLTSFCPTVQSHPGRAERKAEIWNAWATEPGAVLSIALLAAGYWLGTAELKEAGLWGRAFKRWQAWSFAIGSGALALALISPLHPLGQVLFSAHMTQHEILMLVAAPLLVLGRPLPVFLIALPRSLRQPLIRMAHSWGWSHLSKFFKNAFVAWLLHGIILWTWHIPAAFSAAVESEWIHALQHISFVGSALLFWWAVFDGTEKKVGYGVAILYIFSTAVHSGVLGAMLTFSASPWYPPYLVSTFAWHLSPLQDQQLGGLIMWIPASLVYIIAGLVLFAGWLRESEQRAESKSIYHWPLEGQVKESPR